MKVKNTFTCKFKNRKFGKETSKVTLGKFYVSTRFPDKYYNPLHYVEDIYDFYVLEDYDDIEQRIIRTGKYFPLVIGFLHGAHEAVDFLDLFCYGRLHENSLISILNIGDHKTLDAFHNAACSDTELFVLHLESQLRYSGLSFYEYARKFPQLPRRLLV